MGGQTSLSVVGGEMPGKLGWVWDCCVCVLLNWLCGQIRKKSEGELLILGLFHPLRPTPLPSLGLSFAAQLQVWELTCIKTSQTAWQANRNSFLEHLQKLVKLQWFKEICHYGLNRVHLICVGRLRMPGHHPNASSLTDVSRSTRMDLLDMYKHSLVACYWMN